jgi:hypothetical protein
MESPRAAQLRVAFVVAIVGGLVLVVVPLAASQLSASRDADQLVRLASPLLTKDSLHRIRTDLDKAEAVAAALRNVGFPQLAVLSHRSHAAFQATLRYEDPAVDQSLARLPAAQQLAEKVVGNLARRRGQFESAKSLPGLGLTLHQSAWVGIVVGAVLALCGVFGLVSGRRVFAAVAGLIGMLLVVVPLALGFPSKTADTDALLNSLRPFTVQKVRARAAALRDANTVFDCLQTRVIPQVATAARTTPGAVETSLASANSELATASLHEVAAILGRFGGLVQFSARIQPLLADSDQLSAQASMWLLIAPGAAVLIAAALGLGGRRSRS